jgi:nucleolar GTP-binding protein
MQNPFEHFEVVWNSKQLLDYAFSRAESKGIAIVDAVNMIEKIKRKETARIINVVDILTEKIKRIIESVPNLSELPEFYRKLSNILVNNDELKQHLGQINGILPLIDRLGKYYTQKVRQQKYAELCGNMRLQCFGRIGSIIRKINPCLGQLDEARIKLKKIPPIDLMMPSVVIAGYPNVGKSSLVGKISTAQPLIADYPFTTKQIFIGMYQDKLKSRYFQVIDTPGILDRPMADRNVIEKQAILALNTIASMVLFIIDPTITSGYEVEHQVKLYHEIYKDFLGNGIIPVKIILNKSDLATEEEINIVCKLVGIPKEDMILISAKNGTNTDTIVQFLLSFFKSNNYKR